MNILDKLKINHRPSAGALDLLKYIGPGLLVTVGFIDPGNWATNLAAGSEFGYALLWVVTFSSIMLIIIQHNVAHLGIVTGLCLSEATNKYAARAEPSHPDLRHAGQHFDLACRGVGRSHCSADAIRNANQSRRSHRDGCLPRNVTYQYVQQNRTLDYHVRLNHRTFVSL